MCDAGNIFRFLASITSHPDITNGVGTPGLRGGYDVIFRNLSTVVRECGAIRCHLECGDYASKLSGKRADA